MASGFDTSNVSDILAFLSESDDDSDLAADSDIVLDATEEVLQSSESDIYDERDSLFSGNGGKEDDEPGPSSRFTGTGRASMAAEVSDEDGEVSGMDDGGSDSDVESDGKCPPSKRAKCAKRIKGNQSENGVQILPTQRNLSKFLMIQLVGFSQNTSYQKMHLKLITSPIFSMVK